MSAILRFGGESPQLQIVREICNHLPAERFTPRPIPFDQSAIVIPGSIEPAAGQVS
ncbi:hypothetical protein [Rhizobium sp. Pop5]|nr:hypothetical protein [Rhizobium sp. Pop5]